MTCLAVTIAWVLYRAGKDATDAMSGKALGDVMEQVRHGTERHLVRARTTLKAVAPDPVIAPKTGKPTSLPFPTDLKQLEERLWIAAGLHPGINNYVYFGGADGRFVGVNLGRTDDYELRLRRSDRELRSIYSVAGPDQRLGVVATDSYDPRKRPWYERAVARGTATWSPMYTDFIKRMPLLTLAKPVYRDDKSLLGVVSTDLPLTELSRFLQSLSISPNGVAFIFDGTQSLIATSAKELPYQLNKDSLDRLSPAQSSAPLIRDAYRAVAARVPGPSAETSLESYRFDSSLGAAQALALGLRDDAGLDWTLVVAVPRSDFHGSMADSIYRSLALGLVAVIVTLLLGFMILRRALADIRKLTQAARSIGTGEPFAPLEISRGDEIGELAQSFQQMERNLRTDKLTHLLNRDSFVAQIDFRRRLASPANPLRFVLLFIDLDNFKLINDRYGHDQGDRVLVEVSKRLQGAIRKDDAAARFGGDEFVVYLHGVDDAETIETIQEKIREVLEQPIEVSGGAYSYLGASIGSAIYPADGEDCHTLFKVADTRMFRSKKERKTQRALGIS
jgi:diguanylate cyclase